MALGWLKKVVGADRERRQWIAGDDAAEARETAKKLRERVLTFKSATQAEGIAFRTDRDAWEAFWKRYPRAHMEFAGRSADDALAEHAFRQFKRIWNSETKIVRFEGNGVISRAPMTVTLWDGDQRARANVLDAFKLTDAEDRARVITAVGNERRQLEKDIKGRAKRLEYLDKVYTALENGATAIERDGEVIVQGLLPEPMEEVTDDGTAE